MNINIMLKRPEEDIFSDLENKSERSFKLERREEPKREADWTQMKVLS